MKFKEKIIPLLIAVFTAFSCISLTVCAEEDIQSGQSEYIESGDYKYSVSSEDGKESAILEEYTGSDTAIEIPEEIDGYTVSGLGDFTFYDNTNITEITISENFEEFGNYTFYGCTSLMEFKVNEKNEIYAADKDGALISKDGESLMAYPLGKAPEKYTVADGVRGIKASTFAMCKNLKEITLPDSLEYIGNFAFSECSSLETIVLPEKITELGDFVFSQCSSLTDVTLPAKLQKIGSATFANCTALEAVDFPETLTEIGQAAFCSTGLKSVTIPAAVYNIGYSAFGFHTDESGNIVADENFIIMGYKVSYAKTYCGENNIEFVSLDEPETTVTEIASVEKIKITPGFIVGICILCAAVLIVVVIVAVKSGKKKNSEENADEYSDSGKDFIEEDEDTDDYENSDTEEENDDTEDE